MNLVSMKTGDREACCVEMNNPYGYGLRLCLNAEQAAALGIKDPWKAGTVVAVQAMAVVTSATQQIDGDDPSDADGKTEVRLELQITDLGLKPQGQSADAATILYGE